MQEVQVASRLEADLGVLSIDGEMRLELANRLLRAGRALMEDGAHDLLVDLGGVTFMDSASLGALIGLERELRARDGRMVLVDLPPQVHRLLDIAGLAGHFAVAPDEAEARRLLA